MDQELTVDEIKEMAKKKREEGVQLKTQEIKDNEKIAEATMIIQTYRKEFENYSRAFFVENSDYYLQSKDKKEISLDWDDNQIVFFMKSGFISKKVAIIEPLFKILVDENSEIDWDRSCGPQIKMLKREEEYILVVDKFVKGFNTNFKDKKIKANIIQ